jgi:hypothetical protein
MSSIVIQYVRAIMSIILHKNPAAYAVEYAQVRAKLIAQGSSLNQWLTDRCISRQLAYRALRGLSFGRKAVELRRTILREILNLDDLNVDLG